MKFSKILMSSAVVVAAFSGTQVLAADAASGITYSGAVDVSYDYSENDAVGLHVFDNENDGFVLHQVNLSAGKSFDGGIGAFANVILGNDANVVSGDACNDFGGEGGDDGDCDDFDLTQAYVSKSMGNLSVIAGRFVTLAGMEVINPAGNINASRSLLFFTQPLVHTGIRATYKLSDMLSVTAGLNNAQFATTAASSDGDNNTDQTTEFQLAVTPMKNLSAFLTYYNGNEDSEDSFDGDADIKSETLDLVVNFNLTDAIYLGLNADYYNTEDGSGGHDEVNGVAGYAQFKFMPKWRVAARSEYLNFNDDQDGDFIVRSNTLTLAHACSDNLELLVEGRHDRATADVFANETFANINGSRFDGDEDQYTGTIKAILKF